MLSRGLQLDPNDIKTFRGSLVGLSGEHIQVKGHLTLETTYGEGTNTKGIKVRYLIVDSLSPYIIILSRTVTNTLEAVISSQYLVVKY